jgi:molybdenum cofactor guanylyltransferase
MGFAKGQLQIGGKPILEYLLDRFAWPGPTLLVTAPDREHPPGWSRFWAEAVDPVEDQGPLRGVLTALQNAQSPLVVIATVDMPALEGFHLRHVVQRLVVRGGMGLMLRRDGDRLEPFPMACRADAAGFVASQLESGELSMHSLARFEEFAVELAPAQWPRQIWTNLNLPEDLREFKIP